MKIYIDNYNNEKMFKKLGSFNKYLLNKTNVIEVYSDEGIYLVDPNNIHKITYLDKPIKKIKYSDKNDFIIDSSETKLTIVNQIPSDCIILKMETHNYQLNAKSKIKFVVNFALIKNEDYNLHNFYFDVSDDIDINSPLFKEDINVFLSLLN